MKRKILIVDDETDLLDILRHIFSQKGWSVATAKDGRSALELVSEFEPDVVLTDVSMPHMNGIDFLKAMFNRNSEIPVIFLSAFRDLNSMQLAWSYGAFDFLDKPFDADKMLQLAENAYEYGADYVRSSRKRYFKMKRAS